jgi:hypothetical protein
MKSKLALAGAVVVLGLGACQLGWQTHGDGGSLTAQCDRDEAEFCRGNHCDLRVTVSACSAAGIKVTPDDLHLCHGRPTKTINWVLPPAGPYRFTDDGIDYKHLPDHQDFDPATKQKGPFKYSWDDKLQNGNRQYDYWIRVKDSAGNVCATDPRISND